MAERVRYGTIQEFRGADWVPLFSMPWFADRPAQALALFREPTAETPEPRIIRLVIVTKEIYEEVPNA